MDRITHQPPRQQSYGSTSSLRNDSLKDTRKHERRRGEPNQETKQPGSGGPSARAKRTVRQGTADSPHKYGGQSGLGRELSIKANRTSRSEPRKTDRPRRARGLSARHPRTVRNLAQPKLENTTDRKRRRTRTRRTHDEQQVADRPPQACGLSAPYGQS
jgi:hypothetical protein